MRTAVVVFHTSISRAKARGDGSIGYDLAATKKWCGASAGSLFGDQKPYRSGLEQPVRGINEQFYSSEAKQVGAGEIVMLPLENFVSRNGSVRFPVGNRDIKLVTVFSQIATGARAVSEHVMPTQLKVKPSGDLSDEDWIRDVRP